MGFHRRGALKALAGGATALALGAPFAATAAPAYPNKPITLLVPFGAGGATDVQARALAAAATRALGQPVIIQNQPGVAGTLAAAALARNGQADGYTLAVTPSTLFLVPHVMTVSYDPLADFTYIMSATAYTMGISVGPNAPWKSAEELFAYVRANPNKVTAASVGVGSAGHLALEQLRRDHGLQFSFVPYKSAVDEFTALMGGHVDVVLDAGFGAHLDGGKVRTLAILTDERVKTRPDLRTLKEVGVPVVSLPSWGVSAPRNLDPAILQTLHAAFRTAIADPGFIHAIELQDQGTFYLDPEAYRAFAQTQFRTYQQQVADAGIEKN